MPGQILDTVAVHLDAPVGEEELEAVPVAGDVGELLAELRLGRDAGALLFQPVVDRAAAAGSPSVSESALS